MPTVLTTQNPFGDRLNGGGNYGAYCQLLRNSDGTIAVATASDIFGDPAGTYHLIGSHESTGFARNDKGIWHTPVVIIESDDYHLNALEKVTPYYRNYMNPEDILEDGTIYGGLNGPDGDPSVPIFAFFIATAPIGGKARARVFVGHFLRTGGMDQKANQTVKPKFEIRSVDGMGFTPIAPMTGPLSTIVPVALTGNLAQGTFLTCP